MCSLHGPEANYAHTKAPTTSQRLRQRTKRLSQKQPRLRVPQCCRACFSNALYYGIFVRKGYLTRGAHSFAMRVMGDACFRCSPSPAELLVAAFATYGFERPVMNKRWLDVRISAIV